MAITFDDVSYTYQPHTPFENQALQHVSFTIPDHSYTAIIGHTGSGKSTLLQHFNGLLLPTSGQVYIGDTVINATATSKTLKAIRQKLGMVFQFPESQLFADTVLADVMFGPQNFGASEEEAKDKAIQALRLVNLDESLWERSPFELSGGQMRRVAIAGVLAMQPDTLILDEPTAGLDPEGREEMMALFDMLHKKHGMSIVLVTHLMDDVATYAEKVLVMENGQLLYDTTPQVLFQKVNVLKQHHLNLSKAAAFALKLRQRGLLPSETLPITLDELVSQLKGVMK